MVVTTSVAFTLSFPPLLPPPLPTFKRFEVGLGEGAAALLGLGAGVRTRVGAGIGFLTGVWVGVGRDEGFKVGRPGVGLINFEGDIVGGVVENRMGAFEGLKVETDTGRRTGKE